MYLAKASVLASSAEGDTLIDILEWWKNNTIKLPHWSKAAQCVFLMQPSSAAAEHVFSILNRINDKQTNSLENYAECTVMLQYNKHKNKHLFFLHFVKEVLRIIGYFLSIKCTWLRNAGIEL